MFESSYRKLPWRLHPALSLAVASIAVVAGVLAPSPRAAAVPQRNPEDLLIVDCLLPGQVRKLGASSVFMSAFPECLWRCALDGAGTTMRRFAPAATPKFTRP